MNSNDVAKLNIQATGASDAAAQILNLKQSIFEVRQENELLAQSKAKTKAAISEESAELKKYESQVASCNTTIAKAMNANAELAVKIAELEANGKSGSKTWQTLTDRIRDNNQKIEESKGKLSSLNVSIDAQKGKIEQLKSTQKGLADTYRNNSSAIKDNQTKIGSLNSSLKVTEMSYNQLKSKASSLTTALNSTSKALDPETWTKYRKELSEVEKQMSKVSANGTKASSIFSNIQLPGIFGTAQNQIENVFSSVSNFYKNSQNLIKSYSVALKEKKAAEEASELASKEAAKAEQLLSKATAEGKITDELAASAEKARAAATAASTIATEAGSAAMKIFRIALASTGIGILLIALGSLVAYFESTNEGSKKFKQIMAGLGVYLQEFLKIAGAIGKVLFDAFTHPGGAITVLTGLIKNFILPLKTLVTVFNDLKNGNFGDALSHLGDAMKEGFNNTKQIITGTVNAVKDGANAIGKSAQIISNTNLQTINSHAKMAMDVEKQRQQLTISERNYSTDHIKIMGQIEVLEKRASRQSALSNSEKVKAAQLAQQLYEKDYQTRLGFAQKNEQLTNKEQALKSKKDMQAIADSKNRTQELIANKDNEMQTLMNKEQKAEKLGESQALKALKEEWAQREKVISAGRDALKNADKEELSDPKIYASRIKKMQELTRQETDLIDEKVKHHILTESQGQEEINKIDSEGLKYIRDISAIRSDLLVAELNQEVQMHRLKDEEILAGKKQTAQQQHEITLKQIEEDRKAQEDAIRIQMQLEPDKIKELQAKLGLLNQQAKTKTAQENGKFEESEKNRKRSAEAADLANQLAFADKLSTEEYQIKKRQLDLDKEKELDNVNITDKEKLNISKKYDQLQEDLTNKSVDDRLQAESVLSGNIANLFKKNTEAYKIAASIQASIDTYVAANAAYKAMVGIPVVGPELAIVAAAAAIAAGLENVAQINGISLDSSSASSSSTSASSASGTRVLTGKESGGFMDVTRAQDGAQFNAAYDPTKRGYVDRPTVIVGEGAPGNSMEWVASNAAMKNPTVAPIISMIDSAQRSGNISTIDMNYLMRRQMSGFSSGGSIAQQNTMVHVPVPSSSDPDLKVAIARLNDHLDKGLPVNFSFYRHDIARAVYDESISNGSKK
jgi:myosin heavy subunit